MNYLHLAILELEKRSPLSAGFAKEQLAALQQERDEAVKLLAVFAKCSENFEGCKTDETRFDRELTFSPADLHRAAAFLKKVQS